MAKTAPRNPRFYSGPDLQARRMKSADSKTWKAGEWFAIDSSGFVVPVASGGVLIRGIFPSDQDTSTASNELVDVEVVVSTQTLFEGYLSNGDADIAAADTQIGASLGVHVGANIVTVDTNNTSNDAVMIVRLWTDVESAKHAIADNPGRVIFHLVQAVLDADAA